MSKPPIFSPPPAGNTAQQHMHRARMFRNAALELPDIVNGEQNWPRYALLTHAIELTLKAFALHSGFDVTAGIRPPNHDLVGWYGIALGYGLPDDATVTQHISVLNALHQTHYLRYPTEKPVSVPSVDYIADATVDHLLDVFARTVNPR
jgi:hypothetical protein